MNEKPEYCELCAPPGYDKFPCHAGEVKREPGKCYCGKPLAATPPPPDGPAGSPKALFQWREPGCLDFYGQSTKVDELAARIARIENENREWRFAASRISLTPLPDNFTPAVWLSLQVNAISALLEKAKCS